jgi:GNAT superfamily N-acetyltransferase
MSLAVERSDARVWPDDQLETLFANAFPAFITADQVAKLYIDRVRDLFPEFNIMLIGPDGIPVATGWGVPIKWNGEVEDLPTGYTDTTKRAVEGHEAGEEPDTFVICGGIVDPALAGKGFARELITALCDLAKDSGLRRVIAPVRPTMKSNHPMIPIDTYVQRLRPDGAPVDPWLRTHWRIGGRILATAPASQTMTGTIAEWQDWTGREFPSTGDYVIPDGLSTLKIDLARDEGVYVEPNVWIQHR